MGTHNDEAAIGGPCYARERTEVCGVAIHELFGERIDYAETPVFADCRDVLDVWAKDEICVSVSSALISRGRKHRRDMHSIASGLLG